MFVFCCLPDDKCKDTTSEMRCQVFRDIFFKINVLYGVFIKQLDGFGENRKSFVENGLEPGGGIRVFRYSVVSYGVNHEFQPYNNIIINIIIEIFFMYSMRFRFTEYLNT